jgi:hypothetical protein
VNEGVTEMLSETAERLSLLIGHVDEPLEDAGKAVKHNTRRKP